MAPDPHDSLIESPANRHFVQFERDEVETSSDSAGTYVAAGLRQGDGVIAIATPRTAGRITAHLAHEGLDRQAFEMTGQLRLIDSQGLLDQLVVNGIPDRAAFRTIVEPVLERAALGRGKTRIIGDAVGLLWKTGRARAAIVLEEYWNELSRLHRFSLFCLYPLDHYQAACYAEPLSEIGRVHCDVLVTKDDERFRAALAVATIEIFGASLHYLLERATQESPPGEERLPDGLRTMSWLARHMPSAAGRVLARARRA